MPEGDAELQDLYRDVLLDYYRSRAHKGKAEPADVRGHGVSPICGDEVEVTASRVGDTLARVRYDGHGCVISQSSSAMMAEALEGKPVAEVRKLIEAFGDFMVRRGAPEAMPEALEETKALEGVRKFPARVKCAMLSWNTLRLGLEQGKAEFQEFEDHGPGTPEAGASAGPIPGHGARGELKAPGPGTPEAGASAGPIPGHGARRELKAPEVKKP